MSATRTDEPIVMDDDQTHPRNSPQSSPRNFPDSSHQPAGDQPLALRVEALLLSTDRPMSDGKIADLLRISLEDGGSSLIKVTVDELNTEYEQSGRSFRIEAVAGGRQILTRPEFGSILHRLHQARIQSRLSPAAMETLAIVAYRQPALRADIEAIRGVACGEVLRTLMERRLVKIVGRAEEIGRPMLYGTTREFLRIFGLSNLSDLPNAKELREPSVRKVRTEHKDAEIEDSEALGTDSDVPAIEVEVEAEPPEQGEETNND